LHVHIALDPGRAVIYSSHMHSDGSIYYRVSLVYGPILMAL